MPAQPDPAGEAVGTAPPSPPAYPQDYPQGYSTPYGYQGAAPGYGAPASYPPEYLRARENWVFECVDRYRSEDRRDGHGGIIGGLLGAVGGGLIGNRIDHKGSRPAGTLIGAGVGGLAGAAVGSAIDRGNSRKDEDEAVSWCEDYFARNTAQPGHGPDDGLCRSDDDGTGDDSGPALPHA